MMVRMDSLEITQPELTSVTTRGIGFSGFEFKGLAPEEVGKRIVEALEAMKREKTAVKCEALTMDGKPIAGYGIPEKVEVEVSKTTPIMYGFYVVVAFLANPTDKR
jgi:hypothetical protein